MAMPLSLAFRFPARRYHATPYGHHVNEGLIEWPPSPWRLLRALISVGYTSRTWDAAGPPPVARRLIDKLAGELPVYYLPPAVGAHSRHYMPIGTLDNKRKIEKTTLVFDTWARIEGGELIAIWRDVRLDGPELFILRILVERLNYLGRSESWVEGRVIGDSESVLESNCYPEQHRAIPGRGWEQVALLAPVSASDFDVWRGAQLDAALIDLPLPTRRKPSRTLLTKRAKAEAPYPGDLLDCLQKDTTWLRSHGWSSPPGSRRVFYWRPSNAISVGAPKARTATLSKHRVHAMLLSLTNASRNDHALPPVVRILPQAELLHRALVRVAARNGEPPPELTGRDRNRRPLRGPHLHAHINPLDLDGDGHLDHILVWAPMGLGPDAQTAIRGMRRTFTKGGVEPLRLAVAATGDPSDMVRLSGAYGGRIARLVGCATGWQSVTPFVPPRHLKVRGKHTLEGQIRAELLSRGFPEPVTVTGHTPVSPNVSGIAPLVTTGKGREEAWNRFRQFKLIRRHGPRPPFASGFAVRLCFDQPVPGPIALGYGSHFGLGLFEHLEND